jgi:hypothetical protein
MEEFKGYIEAHRNFLNHNREALEIYEGNLSKYIQAVMKKTLSENYYETIKERLVPVNVLTRIVEKLSKVYANPVVRKSNYQEWVDEMSSMLDLDASMLSAEELSFLHKGYALQPYLDENKIPKVRVLPYDRFLPFSDDPKDPCKMTGIIVLMGMCEHYGDRVNLYHYWSDTRFVAFTEKGVYDPDMFYNDQPITGNPIGRIPFIYGNRSKFGLIPLPDSDMVQLTKMIPVVLSDLAGALMYQCFTIIYGINVKSANLKMAPNAFWDIKADAKSDTGTPTIGTINPTADVDKILSYISNVFTLWLETKGIRVGSLGQLDSQNFVSGISKIIDEADTSEVRKKSMRFLQKEEKELWSLLVDINNYWLESEPDYVGPRIGDDFEISIEYSTVKPQLSRKEEVETVKMEYDAGFIDEESLVERLYPELEGDQFNARVLFLRGRNAQSNSRQEPTPNPADIEEV